MKKGFIFILCILFLSCEHPDIRDMLISIKERYENYLILLDNGVMERSAVSELGGYNIITSKANKQLLRLIEIKRSKLYMDRDNDYLRDRALLHLYMSDLLTGFNKLKEYAEKTGDYAKIYYHLADYSSYFLHLYPSYKIVGLINPNEVSTLSKEQLRYSLHGGNGLYFADRFFESEAYNGKEFSDIEEKYATFRSGIEKNPHLYRYDLGITYEDYLLETNYFKSSASHRKYFEDLEKETDLTKSQILQLLQYYTSYYQIPESTISVVRDLDIFSLSDEDFLIEKITSIMNIYLNDKKYSEVIELNQYYSSMLNDSIALSNAHTNLAVSAAYAGIGDLAKSLTFLKKELKICQFQEKGKVSRGEILDGRPKENTYGSIFESMFLTYFIYEEFNLFNKHDRFSEIENEFNNAIDRYSDNWMFTR